MSFRRKEYMNIINKIVFYLGNRILVIIRFGKYFLRVLRRYLIFFLSICDNDIKEGLFLIVF